MAKTWKQIVSEMSKVSPEQTKRDKAEMLQEKGMTWGQFMNTEEYREMAERSARARFSGPMTKDEL